MLRMSGRQGLARNFSNQSASNGSELTDRVDPVVATCNRRALDDRDQ
jgi:hypothetical protein